MKLVRCSYCRFDNVDHDIRNCPLKTEDAERGRAARHREQEDKEESKKGTPARKRANKKVHSKPNLRSKTRGHNGT